MHLAALEQQRELMRYMNSLNGWLVHDVEDRQAERRSVAARIDQLLEDVNQRLGLTGMTRESCRLHHPYVPTFANITLKLSSSPAARPSVEPGVKWPWFDAAGAPGSPESLVLLELMFAPRQSSREPTRQLFGSKDYLT